MSSSPADPASNPLTPDIQIHKLRTGDAGERYYAAWWLGRMRIQQAVTALIEALAYEEDRTEQGGYPVRRNAARALGKLQSAEAIEPLLQVFDCGDDHLYGIVAQSLGEIAATHPTYNSQIVEIVLKWLQAQVGKDTSATALEGVLETLGDLEAKPAQNWIHPYLHHESIRVRCSAARALYLITGDPQYVQHLMHVLDHPTLTVRRGAVMDLGATGYLAGAATIAGAAVEANIKLIALKTMMDRHLAVDCRPTPEVCSVLTLIDTLL